MKNCFIFLLLLPILTFGQPEGQSQVAGLLEVLAKAKTNEDKIKALDDLSFEYELINPDEGILYGQKELKLALEEGNKKAEAAAYANLGLNYKYKSDFASALEYNDLALKTYKYIGDSESIASIYSHIGVVYDEEGNYSLSLDYHFRALKLDQAFNKKGNLGGDYGNLGNICMSMGDYNKAMEYDQKSLAIFEELKNSVGIANNLGNIGNLYRAMGEYAQSIDYNFRALKYFKELGDSNGITNTFGNIATIYGEEGNHSKAIAYTAAALAISKATADRGGIGLFNGNIGEEYYLAIFDSTTPRDDSIRIKGRQYCLDTALKYLTIGRDTCLQLGILENACNLSKYLSYVYDSLGDLKNAFRQYVVYTSLRDSLSAINNKVKISNLEAQHELELKDKQITIDSLEVAKKRNQHALLLVCVLVLFGILMYALRRLYKQGKLAEDLAAEKRKHLARIADQTSLLRYIAHTQSHAVRGPVSTILGLAQLMNVEDPTDPTNRIVVEGILDVTQKLDKIIKDIVEKENNLGD